MYVATLFQSCKLVITALNQTSTSIAVKIPPPPVSQSFAKTAAKSPPPEPQVEQVKPQAKEVKSQPKEVKPDFPSIQEAKDTSTPISNDLSDIPDANEMLKEKSGKDSCSIKIVKLTGYKFINIFHSQGCFPREIVCRDYKGELERCSSIRHG